MPDQRLPVCTEADLGCLKGLKQDEAKVLMEGKIIFGGTIVFQDQLDAKKENKRKKRRFYGKK